MRAGVAFWLMLRCLNGVQAMGRVASRQHLSLRCWTRTSSWPINHGNEIGDRGVRSFGSSVRSVHCHSVGCRPLAVRRSLVVAEETSARTESDPAAPPPRIDCGLLESLANKVVKGSVKKVLPASDELRRRRSWKLYLSQDTPRADDPSYPAYVAVLVVDKKSRFTLDDARISLRVLAAEIGSCVGPTQGTGPLTGSHFLLATRGELAPTALAFLRSEEGHSGLAVGVRWGHLESLVQGGELGHFLDAAFTNRWGQGGQGPRTPPFAAPTWLKKDPPQAGGKAIFDLCSPFAPSGDQPEAIAALLRGVANGKRHQTLLGATGTGKTFIIANVIAEVGIPTLVLAPNKLLAAQLTNELRALFPNNAVEYFVSYYDYYMPEAYLSSSDTYIDKVVEVNSDIDRMRHSATRSLLERRDVIVVATVSCIYGLGMPAKYLEASLRLSVGQAWEGGWRGLARHLEQTLLYQPHYTWQDFEAAPRGAFHTQAPRSNGKGAGVGEGGGGTSAGNVFIGPAADETIIHVVFNGAGAVEKVQATPYAGAEGGPGARATALAGEGTGAEVGSIVGKTKPRRGLRAVMLMEEEEEEEEEEVYPAISSARQPLLPESGVHVEDDVVDSLVIYPAKHHVVSDSERADMLRNIAKEMEARCAELAGEGRLLEAGRLRQRTENDLLMLQVVGTCKGIENYSRHLSGRCPGEAPDTLVDYFPPEGWLLVVDESHVSAPQLGAMYGGDRARKRNLVRHGFRLPSAMDNRPLKADEFWSKVDKTIFLSATPATFELQLSNPDKVAWAWASSSGEASPQETAKATSTVLESAAGPEPGSAQEERGGGRGKGKGGGRGRGRGRGGGGGPRYSRPGLGGGKGGGNFLWEDIGNLVDAQAVIRPTGIPDPLVEIRPSAGQVEDLLRECQDRAGRGERVLVTALTKRMAEDLCSFLQDQGVRGAYLHSEVKPMERLNLLRQLRTGVVDVIVGVNLLREGLNLPEVSLVCVLDADKEGFLRSDTALVQTIGRATRHCSGRAVLYADRVTGSMRRALDETSRRRDIQIRHNKLHGIVPSVARAASVGDSLLDEIGTVRGGGDSGERDERALPKRVGGGAGNESTWPEMEMEQVSLPPDQAQLIYNLAAGGSSINSINPKNPTPAATAAADVARAGVGTKPGGTVLADGSDSSTSLLDLDPATKAALGRLAEQAHSKMELAAGKTDFKEAALWRDRRNGLRDMLRELGVGRAARGEGGGEGEGEGGVI